MSPRWELTNLADMPTLEVGVDADLKFDNGRIRVWLGRLPPEHRHDGPEVIVEERQGDGSWR